MKKHTIYKKISVLSIFIIIVSILIFTANALSNDIHTIEAYSDEDITGGLDNDIENLIALQEPAQEAYSEFLSKLPIDEEGDYVYPSTFSGAYMDEETYKLCIALTDGSEEVKEQYDAFFSDPSIVVYTEAAYSYNELLEIQENISAYYGDTCAIGISQEKNVVEVGIIYDSPQICSEVDPELPIEFYQSSEVRAAALQGGNEVTNQNTTHYSTLGICGTYNGKNAILLCGHGMKVGDKITYGGKEIATIVTVQFANNKKYDYSIATIDSGANVTMSNRVLNNSNYTTITSVASSLPLNNTLICKYGSRGGFGVYKVLDNSVSTPIKISETEKVTIKSLVKCLHERENATDLGDSGGPCYSGHVFYGDISAFLEDGIEPPYDYMFFPQLLV